MDKELQELLCNEAGGADMSDDLFERFVGYMTKITLKNNSFTFHAFAVSLSDRIMRRNYRAENF